MAQVTGLQNVVTAIHGDIESLKDNVDSLSSLGHYCGTQVYTTLPTNKSELAAGATINDFFTFQKADGTNWRYIVTAIAANGTLTTVEDVQYGTDITGKQDKVNGSDGKRYVGKNGAWEEIKYSEIIKTVFRATDGKHSLGLTTLAGVDTLYEGYFVPASTGMMGLVLRRTGTGQGDYAFADPTDGTTIEIGGPDAKFQVKNGGITETKLATAVQTKLNAVSSVTYDTVMS